MVRDYIAVISVAKGKGVCSSIALPAKNQSSNAISGIKHMHHDRRDEATSSQRTSGDEETTESFSSSMTSMERSPNELRTVMQIRSTQNNEEETGTETPSIADEQIAKQASANCLEGSRYDNVMDDDAFLDGLLDPLFDEY
jgi:hypothetical protein